MNGVARHPRPRATPVTITAIQRRVLTRRAHGHTTPHRDKLRAQIVLLAAAGNANNRIAGRLGVTWTPCARGGTASPPRLDGLGDRKRSGRPPRFTPVQVAEVTALACQLPAETGTPLSRWSCPDLAREATARGVADALSASTVRRWLDQHAIKPWQHRSWIFIRDPDFTAKAARVLDLYAGIWDGQTVERRRLRHLR